MDVDVHVGNIWSDIVFDNIFTDMQMHERVKDSIAKVDRAGNQCSRIIRGREDGLGNLNGEIRRAEARLKEARVELQRAREEAFNRVAAGAQGGSGFESDAPPGYAPPTGAPPGYGA
jgi:hypothetical protein